MGYVKSQALKIREEKVSNSAINTVTLIGRVLITTLKDQLDKWRQVRSLALAVDGYGKGYRRKFHRLRGLE